MGAKERREVDELLRSVRFGGEFHVDHLHEPGLEASASELHLLVPHHGASARNTQRDILYIDPDVVLDELRAHDFQTVLRATMEQWSAHFADMATQLGVARNDALTSERLVTLESKVKLLEARVAQLEQRPEMPIRHLPDDGDPFALLRELKTELGEDRFRWFLEDE